MHPAPSDVRPVLRISTAILKPCPRSPRTCEAGTRTFWSSTGTVDEPFSPSLRSSFPGSTPPRSFVTAKAVIRRCSSLAGRPTSLANTVKNSAKPPLEIQCLEPLSTKVSVFSSKTAVVRIEAASEPASGSVRANAAIISPEASFGSHRRFCSSVPYRMQTLQADRLVAADQDSEGGVDRPDLLGHPAVRRRGEPVPAVLLGDRHSEGAELREAADHLRRDPMIALDLGGTDVVLRETAEGVEEGRNHLALGFADFGKREDGVFRNLAGEQGLDDRRQARVGEDRDRTGQSAAHGMISAVGIESE